MIHAFFVSGDCYESFGGTGGISVGWNSACFEVFNFSLERNNMSFLLNHRLVHKRRLLYIPNLSRIFFCMKKFGHKTMRPLEVLNQKAIIIYTFDLPSFFNGIFLSQCVYQTLYEFNCDWHFIPDHPLITSGKLLDYLVTRGEPSTSAGSCSRDARERAGKSKTNFISLSMNINGSVHKKYSCGLLHTHMEAK